MHRKKKRLSEHKVGKSCIDLIKGDSIVELIPGFLIPYFGTVRGADNNDILIKTGIFPESGSDKNSALLVGSLLIRTGKQLTSQIAAGFAGNSIELALIHFKFLRRINGDVVVVMTHTEIELRTENLTKLVGKAHSAFGIDAMRISTA